MQLLRKQEEMILQEIMALPRNKLPQVVKMLRLLRDDFTSTPEKRAAKTIITWEKNLAKFQGAVSSSDNFMKRKAEEKALER